MYINYRIIRGGITRGSMSQTKSPLWENDFETGSVEGWATRYSPAFCSQTGHYDEIEPQQQQLLGRKKKKKKRSKKSIQPSNAFISLLNFTSIDAQSGHKKKSQLTLDIDISANTPPPTHTQNMGSTEIENTGVIIKFPVMYFTN